VAKAKRLGGSDEFSIYSQTLVLLTVFGKAFRQPLVGAVAPRVGRKRSLLRNQLLPLGVPMIMHLRENMIHSVPCLSGRAIRQTQRFPAMQLTHISRPDCVNMQLCVTLA
jgi:hypothetical protein